MYLICTAPVLAYVPQLEAMVTVSPERRHTVEGSEIRYKHTPNGETFLEVVRAAGTVSFSANANMICWIREKQGKSKSNLRMAIPLRVVEEPKDAVPA